MAQVASLAAAHLQSILAAETGLSFNLAVLAGEQGVEARPIAAEQITAENVAAEIAEKAVSVKYPVVQVHCDRVTNELREKFRTFSGKAQLTAEIRVSQDRLEGIEQQLHLCVDTLTAVLDASRGDWGQGLFYTGGYEVTYQPVKHGGRNFLQTAKVSITVDASKA